MKLRYTYIAYRVRFSLSIMRRMLCLTDADWLFTYLALRDNIGCPTRYQTRHFFNNSETNEDIVTKQTHTTDTFLLISHTTNVLLFKSRCNIFIGFRIIKEMSGLVGSGTLCTSKVYSIVIFQYSFLDPDSSVGLASYVHDM